MPALYEFLGLKLPPIFHQEVLGEGTKKGSGLGDPTIDDLHLMCLEALLAEREAGGEEREIVRIEHFENVLRWFGPLRSKSDSSNFIQLIANVLSHRFAEIMYDALWSCSLKTVI